MKTLFNLTNGQLSGAMLPVCVVWIQPIQMWVETFMCSSKPFGLHDFYKKNVCALRVNNLFDAVYYK